MTSCSAKRVFQTLQYICVHIYARMFTYIIYNSKIWEMVVNSSNKDVVTQSKAHVIPSLNKDKQWIEDSGTSASSSS